MRLADYQSILEGTADHVDLSRDSLLDTNFRVLRTFHRKRLRSVWESWKWAELDLTERRYFAQRWTSGTSVAQGVWVWHEESDTYYQKLDAASNTEPSPTNTSVWAVATLEPAPDYYDAATVYAPGDQVAYEGALYQCIAASTPQLPTNTTYWRPFTAFLPVIEIEQSWETNKIGDVWCLYDRDPRATTQAEELSYKITSDGVVVLNADVTHAWVVFRKQVPVLRGDVFSTVTNYAIGDQVYYASATVRGDFYECTVTAPAGDYDVSASSSWSKVEIPLIFAEYLMLAGAADWEKSKRHMDIAAYHSNSARAEMERVQSIELSFEGQLPRTRVNRSQILWD